MKQSWVRSVVGFALVAGGVWGSKAVGRAAGSIKPMAASGSSKAASGAAGSVSSAGSDLGPVTVDRELQSPWFQQKEGDFFLLSNGMVVLRNCNYSWDGPKKQSNKSFTVYDQNPDYLGLSSEKIAQKLQEKLGDHAPTATAEFASNDKCSDMSQGCSSEKGAEWTLHLQARGAGKPALVKKVDCTKRVIPGMGGAASGAGGPAVDDGTK